MIEQSERNHVCRTQAIAHGERTFHHGDDRGGKKASQGDASMSDFREHGEIIVKARQVVADRLADSYGLWDTVTTPAVDHVDGNRVVALASIGRAIQREIADATPGILQCGFA